MFYEILRSHIEYRVLDSVRRTDVLITDTKSSDILLRNKIGVGFSPHYFQSALTGLRLNSCVTYELFVNGTEPQMF